MINEIIKRLEAEKEAYSDTIYYVYGLEAAIEIVQEVANEHRKLNRCDTCNHYVADEVPPICYFCCKGIEDNYEQKGE